jgi:hypothetical protein
MTCYLVRLNAMDKITDFSFKPSVNTFVFTDTTKKMFKRAFNINLFF